MRPSVRLQYPDMKNTDISSVLATMWRDASEEEKRPHLEKEQADRQKYHEDMSEWKKSGSNGSNTSSNSCSSSGNYGGQSQSGQVGEDGHEYYYEPNEDSNENSAAFWESNLGDLDAPVAQVDWTSGNKATSSSSAGGRNATNRITPGSTGVNPSSPNFFAAYGNPMFDPNKSSHASGQLLPNKSVWNRPSSSSSSLSGNDKNHRKPGSASSSVLEEGKKQASSTVNSGSSSRGNNSQGQPKKSGIDSSSHQNSAGGGNKSAYAPGYGPFRGIAKSVAKKQYEEKIQQQQLQQQQQESHSQSSSFQMPQSMSSQQDRSNKSQSSGRSGTHKQQQQQQQQQQHRQLQHQYQQALLSNHQLLQMQQLSALNSMALLSASQSTSSGAPFAGNIPVNELGFSIMDPNIINLTLAQYQQMMAHNMAQANSNGQPNVNHSNPQVNMQMASTYFNPQYPLFNPNMASQNFPPAFMYNPASFQPAVDDMSGGSYQMAINSSKAAYNNSSSTNNAGSSTQSNSESRSKKADQSSGLSGDHGKRKHSRSAASTSHTQDSSLRKHLEDASAFYDDGNAELNTGERKQRLEALNSSKRGNDHTTAHKSSVPASYLSKRSAVDPLQALELGLQSQASEAELRQINSDGNNSLSYEYRVSDEEMSGSGDGQSRSPSDVWPFNIELGLDTRSDDSSANSVSKHVSKPINSSTSVDKVSVTSSSPLQDGDSAPPPPIAAPTLASDQKPDSEATAKPSVPSKLAPEHQLLEENSLYRVPGMKESLAVEHSAYKGNFDSFPPQLMQQFASDEMATFYHSTDTQQNWEPEKRMDNPPVLESAPVNPSDAPVAPGTKSSIADTFLTRSRMLQPPGPMEPRVVTTLPAPTMQSPPILASDQKDKFMSSDPRDKPRNEDSDNNGMQSNHQYRNMSPNDDRDSPADQVTSGGDTAISSRSGSSMGRFSDDSVYANRGHAPINVRPSGLHIGVRGGRPMSHVQGPSQTSASHTSHEQHQQQSRDGRGSDSGDTDGSASNQQMTTGSGSGSLDGGRNILSDGGNDSKGFQFSKRQEELNLDRQQGGV